MDEEIELLEMLQELKSSPDFKCESDSVKRKFELCECALNGDTQASIELNALFGDHQQTDLKRPIDMCSQIW